MESYITKCIAGFLAFNEDLKLINYKLFNEDEIVSNLIKIEDKEVLNEELSLIEDLSDDYSIIHVESNNRLSQYKHVSGYEKIIIDSPNKAGEYLRENLEDILTKLNFFNEGEYPGKIIKIYNDVATYKMKQSASEDDKLLIQAINSIDEIDESISKLIERMREWYIIYFPEMDSINNNEAYIKIIAESENREDIIENYQDSFKTKFEESTGADIGDEDLIVLNNFAKSLYSLQQSRKEITEYIDTKMESIAPNLKDLVGASLGAKLIAHSGSIKKLAMYPSSTVQIMGAEKALFRHMKTGERPPKHGLIFQHPQIRSSNWWNRGKIARLLALKISLAVRRDVFVKEFNPEIKIDFENEAERIEKENPFPKKTRKKREEEKSYEKNSRNQGHKKYQGKKKNKRDRKHKKRK
jgi:nucleolar protein 56